MGAPAAKAGASHCSLLEESAWMQLSAADATLGLAATESEDHVQLTAGESDEIDLGADTGLWDGEDVAAIDADEADAGDGGADDDSGDGVDVGEEESNESEEGNDGEDGGDGEG